MSLAAGWWTGGYSAAEWAHDFTSAGTSTDVTYAPWYKLTISAIYTICQPNVAENARTLNTKNFGRFFAVEDSAGAIRDINWIYGAASQRVAPDPLVAYGDIPPEPDGGTNSANWPRLYAFFAPNNPASGAQFLLWYWYDSTYYTYSLHHYQPECFVGNPAEVVSSMLLTHGMPATMFNLSAFSNCHTSQENYYSAEPIVYFRRDIGDSIAEAIKRIMRHCYDLLGVGVDNKLAMISRDDPPTGPTSMTVADVLENPSWRYAEEHLINYCEAIHGQYFIGWEINSGWYHYPEDPNWGAFTDLDLYAQADIQGHLLDKWADNVGILKYGKRVLDNSSHEIMDDGVIVRRPIFHFPYFYDVDCKAGVLSRIIIASTPGCDAHLRREITVQQDLRGLDFDIGYKVSGIELTGDGETIDDARCIRKKIDFENRTVTSVLLEEV